MSPRLAAVFAHPDDDTYSIGGSVALHAGPDLDLLLILATSGEAGRIADPGLATPESLGLAREQETRASLSALGAGDAVTEFLRYPDGGLASVPRAELVSRLAGRLATFRPDVVVTFGPEGVTGHPDHIAVHRAATEAFHGCRGGAPGFARLLYACVPEGEASRWNEMVPQDPEDPFRLRPVPDGEVTVRVDCRPVLESKIQALRAHRTQAGDLEGVPEDALPLLLAEESFVLGWPRPEPGGPSYRDVFEGVDLT